MSEINRFHVTLTTPTEIDVKADKRIADFFHVKKVIISKLIWRLTRVCISKVRHIISVYLQETGIQKISFGVLISWSF